MRGVFTDQINIDALTRPSLIDSFYDEFNEHPLDASSPEMADALVKPSIWDRWATPEFDRLLSYHFLDEVSPTHPLIDRLIDDWRPLFNEISSSTELILRLHQLFLPMVDTSSLHARTLLNIEVSMIIRMAELQGVSIPDVHSYDAMDVFQQNHFGLCWPTSDGWLSVPFGGVGVVPLTFDQFLSMELIGRNSCMVHPNGVRSLQPLQVVDAMNQQVIDIIRDLFPSFDGLGVQDVIQRVRNHMQSYDYIADHEHEWQSLDVIFSQQGGDCEDLAHLEASLLIRALEDAGFSDVSNSIEFMTGLVGEGMTQFGHTVIHLNFNGQTFVIDSTLSDGMIFRNAYESIYGFKGLVSYSTLSSAGELQRAMAIDTAGLASHPSGVTGVRDELLRELGMTDYYDAFKEYYPTVTDTSQNTAFWAATSSGSGEAQQTMADSGVTQPAFEPIDFDEPVYVGETLRYYDTNTGVAGLMERIDHRVDEMSVNLTNQTMNKYVGQTYNGYFIYDYSRIMSDYTNILDLIQMVTGYLTAITTYCNAFNWIASQLTYDNEPNSEIKARQRLVKSVQGVLLKMVDEVEYFIPLFTQTYDDLNQATYSRYKDEVTMEFQNVESNLSDVFGLGSESIRRNKMMEKVEAEYWYVAVKNREILMQSTVTVPHSRALIQTLNFTDPYSNILGAEPGSARGFANFHNNMELDILAGVHKPIQILENGVLKTRYIKALHYYLPWYFNASEIKAFENADGTGQVSDTIFSVSDVDMFAYNSLRDVFEPTGLNAMKNEFGFFVREPWLDNLDIGSDPINGVTSSNFKSTRLYKFLYANAFKFNAMFEIEAYKQGYSEDYYSGPGKFLDDPQSMVQMMARKRRLTPLEFADILEFNIDKTSNNYGGVPANAGGKTSDDVWVALKDAGYINQYGLFEKTMADQLFNSGLTINTLFRSSDLASDVFELSGLIDANKSQAIWDRLISQNVLADNGELTITQLNDDEAINQWFDNGESENVKNHVLTILRTKLIDLALPDDVGLKEKIAQRIYDIFSVDDYQFSAVQYDFKRPQLFVRAHPNLTSNGYVDMFGNESFSRTRPTGDFDAEWGYKFLNDQFSSGESEASKNANEAAKYFIDTSADSASAPAPDFTDSYLTNWGIYDSSTVNIDGLTYSVSEVRTYLYNHLPVENEGRDFFSNVVLSAAEQKAFYDQYIIAEDDVRPSKYASSSGETFGVWSLPNFIKNTPVAGVTQTYSLGGSSAPVSGIVAPVLPSSSPSYSYDYGLMEKLPFDTRIVSESTEGDFVDEDDNVIQGGKVIGTIQYVDYEDRAVDTSNVNNMDKIKVYESDYAQETIDNLNEIRSFNSLEKPLTPVWSYNDESVVVSSQDIQTYTGLTRNSDDFNAFMGGLIASGYAKPVFQRIKEPSADVHQSNVGKYQLMGYTFLSTFFSGTPTVSVSLNSPAEVAINNLSEKLKSKYEDEWRLNTKLDMFKYFYDGDDFRQSGFLDREENQYQMLRWVGEDVGGPIHGLNEATPFMSYDWHLMKTAHNGMISTHSRARIFYFVIQAYISSIQTIANKLDNLAYKGTGSIEADLQMFEKRVGKQIELFAQINAKTNALVQINNSYYKQKIETIKASDLGIRIAKGVELYGGLTASIVYLVSQAIRAAAAGAGPAAPAVLATAEAVEKVSAGIMIVAGAATVTQRAIALAHEYGIPQKMTADLFAMELNPSMDSNDLKNKARTAFKNITHYKSPVALTNGSKWEPNFVDTEISNYTDDIDFNLKQVYDNYSPYENTNYKYAYEGGARDVWQSASQLLDSKSGDCEDYAVLAASSLINDGSVSASKLRIVNGILGYGGHAPVSHTMVLYEPNGNFATEPNSVGKKQFSSTDIEVIDLVAPRQSDGSNFSYNDYQNQYGFFQPTYSYDEPNVSSANLGYGFQDFEIFGYNPSAAFAPPITPKGPLDLGTYSDGFDPPYYYKIEQTTSRRSKLLIYSDSGATNLVETRNLPKKIEYGQKTLQVTSPSGISAELTLHGNFDTDSPYTQGSSNESLKNQAKDEASSFGVSIDESAIDVGAARGTSSDQPVTYQSNALILPGVSGGAGGGVSNRDLVMSGMKNLLLLEMEEHAILQEMHELALNPIDFSSQGKGFMGYDWPTFQHLQRRLFLIQQKMKKSFLVMKLKAEFLSLIGTRLGEFERQQMSGALDSIFQSHFSQMSHSVESVQLVMQSMESIHQSNYEVENQREKKIWDLAFTTLVEGIMAGVTMISITGPPTASVVKPILNVLFKFIEFFGNLRNPFYLKSVEEVRNSTKMVDSTHEFNELKALFNIENANNDYDNAQNTIYDETGKVSYNADVLGNTGAFKTQNEIFKDPNIEYSLTIDEVVNEYWNVNQDPEPRSYYSPTISDIYKGQIRYTGTSVSHVSKTIDHTQNESLEDYVMRRMSSRYFSDSGDDLIFLKDYIYSMSGTKLFLDEDFFDWIQQRLSAEMMNQIFFSMYISFIRSITSNLGYSGTGGNDAIQTASSLTSEIGNHYFQIHTTLGAWESLQLSINEQRFGQYKQLDRLILEGIISIATAAISVGSAALGKLAATGASRLATITRVALQSLSAVALTASEMTSQLTDIIYNAVDATEENKVMKGVKNSQVDIDADSELKESLDDTPAQRAEKQLRRERKSVGEESLKTAGNTTTGFGSTFVDQSKKVKMKRQFQELFKMMEVSQKVNESRSEFIKSLASNLGYSTAQANVGGSLSSIQGMAKQAADKAVDARFVILEASAKRANSISSAMRNMIMAVATVAASVFMDKLFKGANKKKGASSKNKRSIAVSENMKKLTKSVLNLAIVGGITGVASQEMRSTHEQNEAKNKAGKTEMSKSVGDAASSEKGQQLSGLENRALNAQMNLGATQESDAINKVIIEMDDKLGAAITETLKAVMAVLKDVADKKAKAMKPKGSNAVADVEADYQKELKEAGGDQAKVNAAKSNRNERMKEVIDNLKGNKHVNGLKLLSRFGGEIYAKILGKKAGGDGTKKVASKSDAQQLDKEFDDLTNDMMKFAEKDGQSSDNLKGKSYNELEKLASNPNASPKDRKAARNAMITTVVPSLKLLGKAKGMMKGGILSKIGGALLALVGLAAVTLNVAFLPMIQNAFKNVPGGETDSERAESIKGAAVAMAFANERGRGMGDEPSDQAAKNRRELMAKNPGIIREVMARQSSRESRRLTSRMPAGTAGKALQDMMSSKDPSMSGLAAQIVADSPGSVKANMENAMDAFKGDNDKLLDFMDKVSATGPDGAKMARQMIDSVNGRSGLLYELTGSGLDAGGGDAAKGMSQRMQQMLSTPSSAKRISAIRGKGLNDDERVSHKFLNGSNGMVKQFHKFLNGSNGMVKQLNQLKNQIKEGKGSTAKTERGPGKESDVAQSMIQLFSEGDSATDQMTLDALNSLEKGAITDVLKGLMTGSKVKGGKRAGHNVNLVREELIKASADASPVKQQRIKALAKRLNIDMTGAPGEKDVGIKNTADKEDALTDLLRNPGDTGTATRMEESLEALAGSGKGMAAGPQKGELRHRREFHKDRVSTLQKELDAVNAAEKSEQAPAGQGFDPNKMAALASNIGGLEASIEDHEKNFKAHGVAMTNVNDQLAKKVKQKRQKDFQISDLDEQLDNRSQKSTELEERLMVVEASQAEAKMMQGQLQNNIAKFASGAAEFWKKMDVNADEINKNTTEITRLTKLLKGDRKEKFVQSIVEQMQKNGKTSEEIEQYKRESNSDQGLSAAHETAKNWGGLRPGQLDQLYKDARLRPADLIDRKNELVKKNLHLAEQQVQFKAAQDAMNEMKAVIDGQLEGIELNLQGLAEQQGDIASKLHEADSEAKVIAKQLKVAKEESKALQGGIDGLMKQKTGLEWEMAEENRLMGQKKAELAIKQGELGEQQNLKAQDEATKAQNDQKKQERDEKRAAIQEELKQEKKKLQELDDAIAVSGAAGSSSPSEAGQQSPTPTRQQEAAAAVVAQQGGGASHVAATVSSDGQSSGGESAPVISSGTGTGGSPTSTVSAGSVSSEAQGSPTPVDSGLSGGAPKSPGKAAAAGQPQTGSPTQQVSSTEPNATTVGSGAPNPSPTGTTADTSNRSKAAALMLSNIAEHAGLFSADTRQPVDEQLVRQDGQIRIDAPGEVVKKIIEAVKDSTDSAGAAGYVKDFLLAAGVDVDDPASIQTVVDDPQLLLRLTSEQKENVKDFLMPVESKTHNTTDQHNNVKPQEKEYIKRFVQVAMRAAGVEMAMPVAPNKIAPEVQMGVGTPTGVDGTTGVVGGVNPVGNVPTSSHAVSQPRDSDASLSSVMNPLEETQLTGPGESTSANADNKANQQQQGMSAGELTIAAHQQSVEGASNALATATTALSDANSELGTANETVINTRTAVDSAQTALHGLTEQKTKIEVKIAGLRAQDKSLSKADAAARKEYEDQKTQLEQAIGQAGTELQTANTEVSSLQLEFNTADAALKDHQAIIAQKQVKLDQIQKALLDPKKSIQLLTSESGTLQRSIDQTAKEVEELTTRQSELTVTAKKLTLASEELTLTIRELKGKLDAVNKGEKDVASIQAVTNNYMRDEGDGLVANLMTGLGEFFGRSQFGFRLMQRLDVQSLDGQSPDGIKSQINAETLEALKAEIDQRGLSENQEKYNATMANPNKKYDKALLKLTSSVSKLLDHRKSQGDLTVNLNASQTMLGENNRLLEITNRELADTNAILSSQRSVLSGINDQKAAVDAQLRDKTLLKDEIDQLELDLNHLKGQTDGLMTKRDRLGGQLETKRGEETVLQTTLNQLREKLDALVEPKPHEPSLELARLMAQRDDLGAQIVTAQDELNKAQGELSTAKIALGTAKTKRKEAQERVEAASELKRSAKEGVETAKGQLRAAQAVTSLGKAASPNTGQTLTQMAQALITDLKGTELDAQTDILPDTLGIESGKQSQRSEILRSAVEQMGAKISDESGAMDDGDFKLAMMTMLDAGVPEEAVFAVFDNIQEGGPMDDIHKQMAAERHEAHRLFQLLLEDAGTREPSKKVVQSPEGRLPSHGEAFGHFVSQNPSFMSDVEALAKAGKKLPVKGLKQTAGMAMFGISDQMELAACRDGVLDVLSNPQHADMEALNVAVQDLKTLCRSERNELNSKIPSGDAEMDQAIRHNIRTLTEAIDGIETFQAMYRPTELDAKIAIATVLSNADSGPLEKDAYGPFGHLPNQLGDLAQDIGQSINNKLNLPSYDEIEFQYEDVERQLSDPAVVADQTKYKTLTQRYTELKEFVEKYRLFNSLHQDRLGAEEMLNDPEMKDMAKEKLDDIDQQLHSIDEDLQLFLVQKEMRGTHKPLMRSMAALAKTSPDFFTDATGENVREGSMFQLINDQWSSLSKADQANMASQLMSRVGVRSAHVHMPNDSLLDASTDALSEKCLKAIGDQLVQLVADGHMGLSQLSGAIEQLGGENDELLPQWVAPLPAPGNFSEKARSGSSAAKGATKGASFSDQIATIESSDSNLTPEQKSQFKAALALATIMSGDANEMGGIPKELTAMELATTIQYVPNDRLAAFYNNSAVADGIHHQLELSDGDVQQQSKSRRKISEKRNSIEEEREKKLKEVKNPVIRAKIKWDYSKQLSAQLAPLEQELENLENGKPFLNDVLVRQISDNPDLGAALFRHLGAESSTSTTGSTRVADELAKVTARAEVTAGADGPGVRQASATSPGVDTPPVVVVQPSGPELGSGFRHLFESLPSHVQRDTMGQLTDLELGAFLQKTIDGTGDVSLDVLSAIADSNPTVLNQMVANDSFPDSLISQLSNLLQSPDAVGHDGAVQVIKSLTGENAGKFVKLNNELKAKILDELKAANDDDELKAKILDELKAANDDDEILKDAIKMHHPVGYMGSVLADVRKSPESSLDVVLDAYGLTNDQIEACPQGERLTLLTEAFESLGRAGNQNPAMMSQLLSELSVSNNSSPEMQTRLATMLGDMIDETDPSVGIDLIKDAMVGAMFKDNSLNVCLTLDHLPQNIQDQLTSLSKNDALRGAFQEGFNEYDQTRFDGLRFGLSAASLTSHNAHELVESKKIIKDADSFKAKINQFETEINKREDNVLIDSRKVKAYKDSVLKGAKGKGRESLRRGLSSDPKYVKLQQKEKESKQQLLNIKTKMAEFMVHSLTSFDPTVASSEDVQDLAHLVEVLDTLAQNHEDQANYFQTLKTLACARGYALTQSNVQATSSVISPDGGDALSTTHDVLSSVIPPSDRSPQLMDAANAFKEGLGVQDVQLFKDQATIINKKIDEAGVFVLRMRSVIESKHSSVFLYGNALLSGLSLGRLGKSTNIKTVAGSTTATPIVDLFRSNDSIVRSSRDVKRHRFTTLKSQVNMVNEKTQMDVNQFMTKDIPLSNEVEAAIFLDQVMAQHPPNDDREPDMSKLTRTFARFNQVQAQFPQLRTASVKAFEKQMAQVAIKGNADDFTLLFNGASVGAQQQLMATMGASDPDGANGLKDRAQALKANSFASLTKKQLDAPSAGFVQSSDIDHAQQTMMRHVGEALATLPTKELKDAYLEQLTKEVGTLPFNEGPAKNSVMLARLRGIQQAAQKDGLDTKVFDTSVSKLLGSMSVDQLPLSNRSMDHLLTFMIPRSKDDNLPFLNHLLEHSPKDFDRLQARASIHSKGTAVTKAMSDIRSQQYRSGENIPSFVVTRESSDIAKKSVNNAFHRGIELANNKELSDTAKGEILAQLMIDSPTNFLAVMEGLQRNHGKDGMTPEDRMVASGMHRIANDPGLYQLFTNIQHGNFDSAQEMRMSSKAALTLGTIGVIGTGVAAPQLLALAAPPIYLLGKGVFKVGKKIAQTKVGKKIAQTKLGQRFFQGKIGGSGARQRIMRQVVQHLADHSSSMGTVNQMLIGQGVNRHRDTINLMASVGPERMATMVEEGCLDKDAMKSMAKSVAALSIYNDKLLLPFWLFSPNEIYDGSDISTAIKTLKSALTTAAKMGQYVQAPGDTTSSNRDGPQATGLKTRLARAFSAVDDVNKQNPGSEDPPSGGVQAPSDDDSHRNDRMPSDSDYPIPEMDASGDSPSVLEAKLDDKQDYGRLLLTSALEVSPKDLRIHEDDSKHPEVQEFMDRMAGHAFDAMRHDPDRMAQTLNAMIEKSPAMKGVALAALPRGKNKGLLDSLSRLEDTPQKPALQAMSCLVRKKGARVADAMSWDSDIRFNAGGSGIRFHSAGSGIRFNVKAAAQYLSSASKDDQKVANQFVKAMNYAVDHGLVSNNKLNELYQKTDMDRLIGHCLVLKGDDTPKDEESTRMGKRLSDVTGSSEHRINKDLMKLIPKMMGSVAKHGKHRMDDLNDVFTKINKTVAGNMPRDGVAPPGSAAASDKDPDIKDLKKQIVRQMQNHMVIPDDGDYKEYVLSADGDKRATFTDAFGQALEARIHRFSKTDSLSPIDEKLGAMYRRLEEFQKHPNNIKVRKPGEFYGTQPAHEPTVRDLFASHELDPQDVQHLLAPTTEDRQPGTSFSKTFNTMLNTRIRDVVYYNSPHHQLVRTKLKECRQMVHQGQAPFYRGVQEVMAQHVGAQTSGG